jgi:flagellar protein FliS
MSTATHENYLVTEVLTATPQKLHLMLVEGAIRFSEKARRFLSDGQTDRAVESLIRAREIVIQMTVAVDQATDPALAKKVTAVYLFIFRSLAEAGYRLDANKIADAVRVLEVERETWRAVCGRTGNADASLPSAAIQSVAGPTIPPSAAGVHAAGGYAGGFSIDA